MEVEAEGGEDGLGGGGLGYVAEGGVGGEEDGGGLLEDVTVGGEVAEEGEGETGGGGGQGEEI